MSFLANIRPEDQKAQLKFISGGPSLFETAARNGSTEIAQFIFEQNNHFGIATNFNAALNLAIQNDHLEMVKFLLEKSTLTPAGMMREAIKSDAKHAVETIFPKLLDGVEVEHKDPKSAPPFFNAGFQYIEQSLKNGKFDLALTLVNILERRIFEDERANPRTHTFTLEEEAKKKRSYC